MDSEKKRCVQRRVGWWIVHVQAVAKLITNLAIITSKYLGVDVPVVCPLQAIAYQDDPDSSIRASG